jgi:hypothetical protein
MAEEARTTCVGDSGEETETLCSGPRARKSYTVERKLAVLARYDQLGSISMTAKECAVPRSCIQDWLKSRDSLQSVKSGRQTSVRKRRKTFPTSGAEKRAWYPDMEEALVAWIEKMRAEGITVSGRAIKLQGQKLLDDMYHPGIEGDHVFQFSNGWLNRFIKRHNLTSRAITSIGQKVPENAKQLAESYFEFLNQQFAQHHYEHKFIGGMDETPVWFDLPNSHTYDLRGVKSVKAKTTGKEKLRYTVVLCAMGDGTKLPAMVIFRNLKRIPKGNFPKDVVVQVAQKGSMNSELMNSWKKLVWSKRPQGMFRPKSVLIFDSATSHVKKTVLSSLKQHYATTSVVIPGGMTPLLQPADVSWNRPFKCLMRDKWLTWLAGGETQYTRTGRRRSASYEMVVNWVSECWHSISEELIRKSFASCGIIKLEGISLHQKLASILEGESVTEETTFAEDQTGITDEDSSSSSDDEDLA